MVPGASKKYGRRECWSCRDAERTEQGEAKPGEAMHFVTKHTRSSTLKLHKRLGEGGRRYSPQALGQAFELSDRLLQPPDVAIATVANLEI
jgi:hypothetical protein